MVLDARDHLLEVGGVRVLLGSLYSPRPGPTWATDRDRSHLIVNLVGGMPTFEASSHSCLYLGGPTTGEFSCVAPGAEFAGVYGAGRIVFLEVSPPPHWPAPRWPCLAAFDLRVLQAARTIQHQVAAGRTRGLLDLIAGIWAHVVRDQEPCDVRRFPIGASRKPSDASRRRRRQFVRPAISPSRPEPASTASTVHFRAGSVCRPHASSTKPASGRRGG